MGKSTRTSTVILCTLSICLVLTTASTWWACGQTTRPISQDTPQIQYGAEILIQQKINLIQHKKIAIVTNHTGRVFEQIHLVDTLMALNLNIQKIFAPEHGFRGEAEAGAHILGGKDMQTGLPLISLYGDNKKPSAQDLKDVDLILFDIQDVGTRFYTYLSTLVYVMEACAENNVALWVLDRPNPNGWYIGGPMLDSAYASFVGLHNVPVVHGMTLGEYARMVNAEGWLKGNIKCRLEVIPCAGYRHDMRWADLNRAWVPPSPNLPTALSAAWYPVFCWYEGTPVSVGRGTDAPFEQVGAPWHIAFKRRIRTDSAEGKSVYSVYGNTFQPAAFMPMPIPGKALQPLYEAQTCYGVRALDHNTSGDSIWLAGLQLLGSFHQEYKQSGNPKPFFQPFFRKLAGNATLEKDIESGKTTASIMAAWNTAHAPFRGLRKKYLLYP